MAEGSKTTIGRFEIGDLESVFASTETISGQATPWHAHYRLAARSEMTQLIEHTVVQLCGTLVGQAVCG
jgi:hypothetical protein